MFLRSLNNEQKKLVLALANKATFADGMVAASEKQLINGMKDEMGISLEPNQEISIDEIYQGLLAVSSRKELVQITFEILGIMKGDTNYDSKEKEFMVTMCKQLKISETILDEMEKCVDDYYTIYQRIDRLTNQ